ncbi:MAG: alpha/beta hydrolase [Alphaproteobacteria bacterium GM202ARS2]|nr:alpha/beta hydrolase [Alphaproteobacteria bacterium GM202ARS2]
MTETQRLNLTSPSRKLAYRLLPGNAPTVVFLHGLGSDMSGAKAEAIQAFCGKNQRQCLCFDLSGHGESDDTLQQEVISQWLNDIEALLAHINDKHYLLVGSSFGAWLSFLAARRRNHTGIVGIIAIAAAIDASHRLLLKELTPAQRAELKKDHHVQFSIGCLNHQLSPAFFTDAERYLLLNDKNPSFAAPYPTCFLHGLQDPTVPHSLAFEMLCALDSQHPHTMTLIKDGDHRLSDPFSLARLTDCLQRLCKHYDTTH